MSNKIYIITIMSFISWLENCSFRVARKKEIYKNKIIFYKNVDIINDIDMDLYLGGIDISEDDRKKLRIALYDVKDRTRHNFYTEELNALKFIIEKKQYEVPCEVLYDELKKYGNYSNYSKLDIYKKCDKKTLPTLLHDFNKKLQYSLKKKYLYQFYESSAE